MIGQIDINNYPESMRREILEIKKDMVEMNEVSGGQVFDYCDDDMDLLSVVMWHLTKGTTEQHAAMAAAIESDHRDLMERVGKGGN